jgi:ADP-heptose:LPS heptosyltransferase
VLVFRALVLGDMLCAIPALRALRRHHPHARIVLAGLPWSTDLQRLFPRYIDDVVPFPGFPGMPERDASASELRTFMRTCRALAADWAIQMHGSGTVTNSIVAELGARRVSGFHPPGQPCPDGGEFMPFPTVGHEIHRLLQLLEFLGVEPDGDQLEFPRGEPSLPASLRARLAAQPYVCIHPGAQLPSRRWRSERFARVADHFAGQGYAVVLTGTAGESSLLACVERLMEHQVINLAGQTRLEDVGWLIAGARLLICNDTGISHIAAALQVPSVVLVMGSDPSRWAPLQDHLHAATYHYVPCRPCMHRTCPIGHVCADLIGVDDVLAAANAQLDVKGNPPCIRSAF